MDLIKTYHCPVIDCEKNFGSQIPALTVGDKSNIAKQYPKENPTAQELFSISQPDLDNDFSSREDSESKSEASVTSAAPSLVSMNDSIFSIVSGSSMPSLAGPTSTVDRLVALLLNDEVIKSVCVDALIMIGIEYDRFERHLRRLLKEFAVELRKEAECEQHRQAAQFVRLRARNSAYIICSKLGNTQKVRTVDFKADDTSEDSGSNGSDGRLMICTTLRVTSDDPRLSRYYETICEPLFITGELHIDFNNMRTTCRRGYAMHAFTRYYTNTQPFSSQYSLSCSAKY